MPQKRKTFHAGNLVTDAPDITIDELCEACRLSVDQVGVFVEEGIVEPEGTERSSWRFSYSSVITVNRAKRLESALGLNPAGVALALDLLEQIENLKRRLKKFEDIS
jgi:chaperone modulatory protein CbpM